MRNPAIVFLSCLVAVALSLTACDDTLDPTGEETATVDQAIIADFADEVVIPTYSLLADRAEDLRDAVSALVDDTTEANLIAAQEAWVAARSPWEQSEGFLFGPVDSLGLDPSMDSWPLNRADLEAVLASGDSLTPQSVALLPNEQRGFHTVEFLLFGEGGAKEADDLTGRELEYLAAAAELLVQDTAELRDSWTVGVGGAEPYRDVFATAGDAGNGAYPSLSAAAQDIINGMSGICDEVANGKIADPFDNQDTGLVESQWSFNSLTDFTANLYSVRNAYLGSVPDAGTSGVGITSFVAELDPTLDARVRAEIQAAIDALGQIPEPFRAAITDPASADEIEAAQAAIRTLQQTLDGDVLPLVTQ